MRNRVALPLFLGIAFALYANSFGGEFLFDDLSTFRKPALRKQPFLDLADNYRPVRHLSLAVDRAIFGDSPWGYHVSNALFHGVTSFVVFVLLRRLAGPAAALAGALLFAAHPVHTESVAYISGRRDLLTTLFYLLGFLSWLEFRRTSRRRWLLAGLLLYALAVGAKEMAVTLPAACLLHDLLFDPAGARRRIPVYAAAGVLAAAVSVYVAFFSHATRQHEWHGGSMAANFATSARLVVHYATLLVFPLRLLGDYSFEAFPLSRSFLEGRALLSLAAIGAAGGAAVRARRRAPLVPFGVGWFLVTLLPVLHVKPFHELAAEHYLYLPSVGFCLLAGLLFERVHARRPRFAWAALGLVLAAFSVRTVVRNRDWRDSDTFWRVTAEAAPRCARAHFNVGTGQANRGEWKEAAASLERAIAVRPDYLAARYRIGILYGRLGRPEDARAQWEEALRLAKGMRSPGVDPGALCFRLGRLDEAIRIYEGNLRDGVRPTSALEGLLLCHTQLGDRAVEARRPEEAPPHYRRALWAAERLLRERPDDRKLLLDAARLALRTGDRRAADDFRRRAERLRAPRR